MVKARLAAVWMAMAPTGSLQNLGQPSVAGIRYGHAWHVSTHERAVSMLIVVRPTVTSGTPTAKATSGIALNVSSLFSPVRLPRLQRRTNRFL